MPPAFAIFACPDIFLGFNLSTNRDPNVGGAVDAVIKLSRRLPLADCFAAVKTD